MRKQIEEVAARVVDRHLITSGYGEAIASDVRAELVAMCVEAITEALTEEIAHPPPTFVARVIAAVKYLAAHHSPSGHVLPPTKKEKAK